MRVQRRCRGTGRCALAGCASMTTVPPPMCGTSIGKRLQETKMARKPATRAEFVLFDVVYEDGSRRSNRRVPSASLGGLDGDAAARAIIEEQDRLIAEKSGTPPIPVK